MACYVYCSCNCDYVIIYERNLPSYGVSRKIIQVLQCHMSIRVSLSLLYVRLCIYLQMQTLLVSAVFLVDNREIAGKMVLPDTRCQEMDLMLFANLISKQCAKLFFYELQIISHGNCIPILLSTYVMRYCSLLSFWGLISAPGANSHRQIQLFNTQKEEGAKATVYTSSTKAQIQ